MKKTKILKCAAPAAVMLAGITIYLLSCYLSSRIGIVCANLTVICGLFWFEKRLYHFDEPDKQRDGGETYGNGKQRAYYKRLFRIQKRRAGQYV